MAKAKERKNRRSGKRSMFFGKMLESYVSVIPIILVVVVIYFTGVIKDFNIMTLVAFLISAALIGFGLTWFNLGIEESMSKIGSIVGETLFKKKNIFFIVAMTFIIGVLITVAEPDLKVMASQVGWNENVLIIGVGIGVGLFVTFGVLRIIFNKSLNVMFICFYGIVFMLAAIVNPKFLPIAFDSGGVTTGPVTVPFILAFGAGLAATKSNDHGSGDDSFGLTALASVGPITTVMVMSLFMNVDDMFYKFEVSSLTTCTDWSQFWGVFGNNLTSLLLEEVKDVGIAILPIFAFFLIYDLFFAKISFKSLVKIFVNMIYAYIGLVIFLSAVNLGFLPVAQEVGRGLGGQEGMLWLSLIVGGLFGLFGVVAEPAVHVLTKQIEKVSEGTIKGNLVLVVMAIAVGGGVALAVLRAYYGFSILYYMIPGYFIALGLTFLVPKIYTAMAFDSGGVASGPMASTFVMPFVLGISYGKGELETSDVHVLSDRIYEDAFGCVAMIALMPLIVIQLLGLVAGIKRKMIDRKARKKFFEKNDAEIIEFVEEA